MADLGNPVLDQLVFARFLASGEFERHVRRVRIRQRARRDAMLGALREHLPHAQVLGVAAGLHLLVTLPEAPTTSRWRPRRTRRACSSTRSRPTGSRPDRPGSCWATPRRRRTASARRSPGSARCPALPDTGLGAGDRSGLASAAVARVFHATAGSSRTVRRRGGIVAGYLAPHPPHLVYAENPPQNEPRSTGGWEVLRWGYEELRRRLAAHAPDVLVVHAPHWITMVGHHVNCVPNPRGISVEPIFPHLFRYHYDFATDVDLAEAIVAEAADAGLVASAMRDPGVRVDYATIGALHLANPAWDIPVVSLSANNNPYFYSDAALDEMETLGAATARAIERTGRRAVLLASNSLSHLHWDREPDLPEDMGVERPFDHHQYAGDMELLQVVREGPTERLRTAIPKHIAATQAETKAGSLTWLLAAMGWPAVAGDVLAYGTVIATGNAVVEWVP